MEVRASEAAFWACWEGRGCGWVGSVGRAVEVVGGEVGVVVEGRREVRYVDTFGKSSAKCSAGYIHIRQQPPSALAQKIHAPKGEKTKLWWTDRNPLPIPPIHNRTMVDEPPRRLYVLDCIERSVAVGVCYVYVAAYSGVSG